MFNGKSILITGGTGSFGQKFTQRILMGFTPAKIVIYSRDEFKQYMMAKDFSEKFPEKSNKLRFFIGDVRDKERLYRAFDGIDYVVHAAAMKQVPACEYNPLEAIKTNINGAQNIIDAAIDCKIKNVIALSTDKAVNPINLYGGTKFVSDKLFIAANVYSAGKNTKFSVVRYGNVAGSRGSVIPYFKELIKNGEKVLPVTDIRMTRFWITLDQGINLVFKALKDSKGGETYISKIPSFKIKDLAMAMNPNGDIKEIGIRDGEKIHEVMISKDDCRTTYEYKNEYIIYPNMDWQNTRNYIIPGGNLVKEDFEYNSATNSNWLSIEQLRKLLSAY
ncbi:UDP-N-acetylglucosamine 4,6-dehydratase (inverting) [uncultured Clostridium sp.]|uniref:UDP-N-acetylglucosamine 4,6-dehydratase (inverting) n=1 Tax=uncultured Clostridium sp. TaxID=59620 RepID=UPI0025D00318|nr:UDP-N-acetylglucosamine 4,6-dehydratase (inverting) [uncultured Clostridium sp.]